MKKKSLCIVCKESVREGWPCPPGTNYSRYFSRLKSIIGKISSCPILFLTYPLPAKLGVIGQQVAASELRVAGSWQWAAGSGGYE